MIPTFGKSQPETKNLLFASALMNTDLAIESWSKLSTQTPIEAFPGDWRHWLPLIYVNLSRVEHEMNFPHRERLRSCYRSAFMTNSKRLSQVKPLLEKLESLKLRYSLIKGMGVALQSGYLGIRSMGDCDLLVDRQHVLDVLQVCNDLGFQPWTRDAKKKSSGQHSGKWTSVGPWVDRSGFIVDIHVSETDKCAPLSQALHNSTITERTFGVSVPDAARLTLLSILHGMKSSGAHDRANTLIDIAALRSQVDVPEFTQLLEESHMSEVATLLRPDVSIVNDWLQSQSTRRGASIHSTAYLGPHRQISKVSAILWFRRPRVHELRRVLRSRELRRFRYLIWILSGRNSSLEKSVARLGGFLRKGDQGGKVGWCDPFEIRWKIRARSGSRIRVRFVGMETRMVPRVVTVSGASFGMLPWEGLRQIEIALPQETQEVVVRSIDHDRCFGIADHQCFQLETLND